MAFKSKNQTVSVRLTDGTMVSVNTFERTLTSKGTEYRYHEARAELKGEKFSARNRLKSGERADGESKTKIVNDVVQQIQNRMLVWSGVVIDAEQAAAEKERREAELGPFSSFEAWAQKCIESDEAKCKASNNQKIADSYVCRLWSFYNCQIKDSDFGKTPISSITPGDVDTFLWDCIRAPFYRGKTKIEQHKVSHGAHLWTFIKKVYTFAKGQGLRTLECPCTTENQIKQPEQSFEILTVKERKALYETCETSSERVIVAFLLLAVRPGEICGLRWSNVSADGDFIWLRKQVQKVRLKNVPTGMTERGNKTRKERRLPIPTDTTHFFVGDALKRAERVDGSDFIINQDGNKDLRCSTEYISRLIPILCTRAKIRRFNAYRLKHTGVTSLFELHAKGHLTLEDIRDITGVSLVTLLKNYAQAKPMDKLRGALSGKKAS